MAAKGSSSKEILIAKLKEVYPNSFMYEKNLIIPFIEDGQEIQLKVALTCCKTNIEQGGDVAIPGATNDGPMWVPGGGFDEFDEFKGAQTRPTIEPTAEEKQNVSAFLKSMGF